MPKTTQPQPDPPAAPKVKPRWRRWLRRIGLGFLLLLAILLAFHRPIIFEGTRFLLVRVARQQNLEITYQISGSIFTTLRIQKLVATPIEPGPIQQLEIGTLALQYSLLGLAREGPHAFLKTLEARDIFIEITPAEKTTPEKQAEPQSIKFPALFPERLVLENVNFTSHGPQGDTVLKDLELALYPDAPGQLAVEVLDIPGVRRWEGVTAQTSYTGRRLVLRELVLGPEIALEEFVLDASQLEKQELTVSASGRVFTSQSRLDVHVTDLNATNHLDLRVESAGELVLAEVWAYLNIQPPVHGTITQMDAHFTGLPETPRTWALTLRADAREARFQEIRLGDLDLDASADEGAAELTLEGGWDAENSYGAVVRLPQLPENVRGFGQADLHGTLRLELADVQTLGQLLPEGTAGDLRWASEFTLANGRLELREARASSQRLALAGVQVQALELHAPLLARDLRLPKGAPLFRTARVELQSLETGSLQYGGYATDSLTARATLDNERVEIGELRVNRGENRLEATGTYTLPGDLKGWLQQPGAADLLLDAPRLEQFLAEGSPLNLSGALKVEGQVETQAGSYGGEFTISGRGISAQGLPVQRVDGRVDLAENRASIRELVVELDGENQVNATGEIGLSAPYAYQGTAHVDLASLAVLRTLLPVPEGAPGPPALGGSLAVEWSGQGQIGAAAKEGQAPHPARHSGNARIDLRDAQYADRTGLAAQGTLTYTPESFSAPDLRLAAANIGEASLAVQWEENRLTLSQLLLRRNERTLVEGQVEAPLVLAQFRDARRMIPVDEPISVELRTRELDIGALLAEFTPPAADGSRAEPPVRGLLTLDLTLAGSLRQLQADLALRGTRLQSPATPTDLRPAELDVDAQLRENRLTFTGEARQPLIQPLTLSGNMPLDPAAVLEQRTLDPATPIELRALLPASSLAVLPQLLPQIRATQGEAALDVTVTGTIGQPIFAGAASGQLDLLRFTDPSLPPIDNFSLLINFAENTVYLNRLEGRVAGGEFLGSGTVNLADSANPVLDLRLGSRNALVLQNDDLTVRTSANLTLAGPLNSAALRGEVYITRGRFYKDVEILPIGLPGRPAPQPPADPRAAGISFPNPPLRDWTFDVAIRTADPFLVQGNLAVGELVADLRLGGTGQQPWLEGNAHLRNFTASLPFSRLRVEDGLINFEPQRPFIPLLNIQGTSTIRDYDVRVYISGTASNPQARFSSDPPLPQSDIVALIATGTTTTELGNDPNALAGRGAVLLFQKLYRSVFNKDQPLEDLTDNTFLNRVQFDLGSTDPKTGQQSAAARVPLAENIVLVGGVDVGGNFRGEVKYLIRFR